MPDRGSDPTGFWEHYWRGLGLSTRNNSLAYGFSVAIAGGFGMLEHFLGAPSVADVFVFVVGACAPFSALNPIVTRGFRKRVEREPPMVIAVGTSLSVVSVSAGVGLAALIGWALRGWLAWLLGAFAGASVYLLAAALEIAAARGVHRAAGTDDLEER